MDELVNLVVKKTGLPKETAKLAVETVIGYLKKKLPKPVAGQIDALLSSGAAISQVESLASGLGSMLKKSTAKKKK